MNEPVRVMLLLSSLNGGGAERVAVHLLNRSDPAMVDVRMGLLRREGPFLSEADPSRIETATIGKRWFGFQGHNSGFYRPDRLAASIALAPVNYAQMIRAHRPQVVMSFLKGVSLLTWMAMGRVDQPRPRWIVREGNNTDAVIEDEVENPIGRAIVKGITRKAYRAADCFLANSHEMARGLQARLALDPDRVRVIQNPIDVARVQRMAQEPLSQAPARPFILNVGRLEYQKGHDVLLKAFAASEAARGLDLVILGRGTLEAGLRRLAADLGIADRVHFPGFVPNPWAWLARARLFALSSRWEGFPSVVAEALACGAPALVTSCDFGPAEVVEHGQSGWVVPPHDVTAFGAAMDHLLRRPDLTARMAANGPARAARFDVDSMVEAYTNLFFEQAGIVRPVHRSMGFAEDVAVAAA
jgi:glycosyltransferase involved in cell wall biosynthesis